MTLTIDSKSMTRGGTVMNLLGLIMLLFSFMPSSSGATGLGGLNMMQIGLFFLVIGFVMIIYGVYSS